MVSQFKEVEIPVNGIKLSGDLTVPEEADGIVVFAHGSGSSRHSSRNKYVAKALQDAGFATLLFDLLTVFEDQDYSKRFEIGLLSERLIHVTQWLKHQPQTAGLSIGYFGASTGAAATLEAAAGLGHLVKAIVSRGGRPDLASDLLPDVKAPALLIVGSLDHKVIELNEQAFSLLNAEKELLIIEGATHLFEEKGKLEEVAEAASKWFAKHFQHVNA